jgi:hypothetical protein
MTPSAEIKVLSSLATREAYLELVPQFERASRQKGCATDGKCPRSGRFHTRHAALGAVRLQIREGQLSEVNQRSGGRARGGDRKQNGSVGSFDRPTLAQQGGPLELR